MADFPYCTVAGRIPDFFKKIKGIGVPSKVDNAWLKTINYTSSNDRSLIPVLKFIDFIDGSNIPTGKWKQYRSNNAALAEGIKQGYKDLFDLYPDAPKRNKDELAGFFKSKKPGVADQAIAKTIATFNNLCDLVDFTSDNEGHVSHPQQEDKEQGHAPASRAGVPAPTHRKGDLPSLNINIQVHLSSDLSVEQIEQVFASMAKHLYKQG